MTKRASAVWRSAVGPTPVCGPADHEAAWQFVRRITQALEAGGWSKHECDKMYAIRSLWRRRAEGRDARFELVGSGPGKLTVAQEAKLLLLRKAIEIREAGEQNSTTR